MTNGEAKFILAAYRPCGRDAEDPLFAEALAQARDDPDLRTWFISQLAFDASVCAKFRELQPPAGLRETVLAGARVSRAGHRPKLWQRRIPWLTLAAAAAVLVVAGALLLSGHARPDLDGLTRFALHDTAHNGTDHFGSVGAMRELEARLAATNFRSDSEFPFNLERLRADGCRTVRVAGHEVFEICFGRDHEFHLYFARRGDLTGAHTDMPKFTSQGPLAAATWADSRFAYSLVTSAGTTALRQRF